MSIMLCHVTVSCHLCYLCHVTDVTSHKRQVEMPQKCKADASLSILPLLFNHIFWDDYNLLFTSRLPEATANVCIQRSMTSSPKYQFLPDFFCLFFCRLVVVVVVVVVVLQTCLARVNLNANKTAKHEMELEDEVSNQENSLWLP